MRACVVHMIVWYVSVCVCVSFFCVDVGIFSFHFAVKNFKTTRYRNYFRKCSNLNWNREEGSERVRDEGHEQQPFRFECGGIDVFRLMTRIQNQTNTCFQFLSHQPIHTHTWQETSTHSLSPHTLTHTYTQLRCYIHELEFTVQYIPSSARISSERLYVKKLLVAIIIRLNRRKKTANNNKYEYTHSHRHRHRPGERTIGPVNENEWEQLTWARCGC